MHGAEPQQADVAIRGDRIAGVGDFKSARAKTVIDAKGFVVAPASQHAFLATESLIQDGRSQSEIRQGVDDRDHGRRRIDGAGERPSARAHAARSRTSNTK